MSYYSRGALVGAERKQETFSKVGGKSRLTLIADYITREKNEAASKYGYYPGTNTPLAYLKLVHPWYGLEKRMAKFYDHAIRKIMSKPEVVVRWESSLDTWGKAMHSVFSPYLDKGSETDIDVPILTLLSESQAKIFWYESGRFAIELDNVLDAAHHEDTGVAEAMVSTVKDLPGDTIVVVEAAAKEIAAAAGKVAAKLVTGLYEGVTDTLGKPLFFVILGAGGILFYKLVMAGRLNLSRKPEKKVIRYENVYMNEGEEGSKSSSDKAGKAKAKKENFLRRMSKKKVF
jgi:hypothetical protein